MFELTHPTTVLLASVTNRSEHHGDDMAPAVSLGLTVETTGTILDSLCPQVRALLGAPGIECVSLKTVCQGWTVLVEHGFNEDEPIKLTGCKLDKFRVSPRNEGAVELRMRVASSDLTPLRLGLLGMKVQQEIVVKMTAPKGSTQIDDDGVLKAEGKRREQQAAGQMSLDDPGEQDTPEKAFARGTPVGEKRVAAKYRDPMTGETWSGRGLMPKWLKAATGQGKALSSFAV